MNTAIRSLQKPCLTRRCTNNTIPMLCTITFKELAAHCCFPSMWSVPSHVLSFLVSYIQHTCINAEKALEGHCQYLIRGLKPPDDAAGLLRTASRDLTYFNGELNRPEDTAGLLHKASKELTYLMRELQPPEVRLVSTSSVETRSFMLHRPWSHLHMSRSLMSAGGLTPPRRQTSDVCGQPLH